MYNGHSANQNFCSFDSPSIAVNGPYNNCLPLKELLNMNTKIRFCLVVVIIYMKHVMLPLIESALPVLRTFQVNQISVLKCIRVVHHCLLCQSELEPTIVLHCLSHLFAMTLPVLFYFGKIQRFRPKLAFSIYAFTSTMDASPPVTTVH